MSWRKRPIQWARTPPSSGGWRLLIVAVGILILVVVSVLGRQTLALLARRAAARQLDVWAISAAEKWLAAAAWLDPDSGELELLRATCHRHRGESGAWLEALAAAEQKGVSPDRIEHHRQLVVLGSGQLRTNAEDMFLTLVEAGVSPQDASTALLACYFEHRQYRKARLLLEKWGADYADDPHIAYLWGLYWRQLEEYEKAREQGTVALAAEPRHELARELIADLSETRNRPDHALHEYIDLLSNSPGSTAAKVGTARALGRLAHTSQARDVLMPLVAGAEPRPSAVLEMAQVEFESGNYQESQRWFAAANLEWHAEKLLPAAITSTFVGDTARAEHLFTRYDAKVESAVRAVDLQIRSSIDPSDRQAVAELQQLLSQSFGQAMSQREPGTGPIGQDRSKPPASSAEELYGKECSACHGANGDGRGRAARHLFPRPLDFCSGGFRLTSTFNGVPTADDLDAVTRQGIPGTSMPAFEEFTLDQREVLVDEVLRLHRQGIRAKVVRDLSENGEELDGDEIVKVVEMCVTPGNVVSVPEIGPSDSRAIQNGKQAYFDLGCHHCHGDDGRGAPDMVLMDDSGRSTRPRDLAYESFKGGQDPKAIYLRIIAGMPGTPHPACWNVSQETLVDLVQFCRSLSRDTKIVLTNHERAVLATSRAYLSAVPPTDLTRSRETLDPDVAR